jgi:hypothetical protein
MLYLKKNRIQSYNIPPEYFIFHILSIYWKVGLRSQKKHKYALFEVKKYGDYEFEV